MEIGKEYFVEKNREVNLVGTLVEFDSDTRSVTLFRHETNENGDDYIVKSVGSVGNTEIRNEYFFEPNRSFMTDRAWEKLFVLREEYMNRLDILTKPTEELSN